jgi:hypothetical protein
MNNKYLGFYQNNYSYLVEKGFKILFISAHTGAQVFKNTAAQLPRSYFAKPV